jgi:pSer/pThr/pTyr-binding forkhead associated (FHA) protein
MSEAEIAAAERQGDPYLVYLDGRGDQRVLSLPDAWERVTIGRGMSADVALTWDEDASRVHAELVRLADAWVVVDDGLSRNGTFVNGERVTSRRRLLDGDELRVGRTEIRFRAPFQAGDHTRVDTPRPGPP